MVQRLPTKALLLPAKAAAMCTARGVVPEPVCVTGREMVQPLPTKALL